MELSDPIRAPSLPIFVNRILTRFVKCGKKRDGSGQALCRACLASLRASRRQRQQTPPLLQTGEEAPAISEIAASEEAPVISEIAASEEAPVISEIKDERQA
jgi:hypothetical protein